VGEQTPILYFKMDYNELNEQLKTTRNLCDVAIILVQLGKENLLPTILETLHQETQGMIDDYCVVKDFQTCPQ